MTEPTSPFESVNLLRKYSVNLKHISDLTDDPVQQIFLVSEIEMFKLAADRLEQAYQNIAALVGVLEHLGARPFFNYEDQQGGISQFGWLAAVHCETIAYVRQLVRWNRDNQYPIQTYEGPAT